MLSEDLKGGKLILTCYQVTPALSDFSLTTDIKLLHGRVTEDGTP